MVRSLAVLISVGLSIGVVGVFPLAASAAIEIALVNGQHLHVDAVHVDENSNRLVVRLDGERVSVTRFISWNRIRSVRIDSETLSREQLIARFGATSRRPVDEWSRPTNLHFARSRSLSNECLPLDAHPSTVRPVSVVIGKTSDMGHVSLPSPIRRIPSIQRISLDAQPQSSRGKVDWDALALQIVPIDQAGNPTFVRGTLQATLWGVTRHARNLSPTRVVHVAPGRMAKPRSFSFEWIRPIAKWTRSIDTRAAFFRRSVVGPVGENGPEPLHVVLPMPRPLPENDKTLTPFGVLHVTLLVPGQGVFEATRTGIPLQHVDPFRSQMLLRTGSRFLPQERRAAGR